MGKENFYVKLKEYCSQEVQISKREAKTLLEYLDVQGDGFVDLDKFLIEIRGKPNKERQAYIDKAFKKFDQDSSGSISVHELRVAFNCS